MCKELFESLLSVLGHVLRSRIVKSYSNSVLAFCGTSIQFIHSEDCLLGKCKQWSSPRERSLLQHFIYYLNMKLFPLNFICLYISMYNMSKSYHTELRKKEFRDVVNKAYSVSVCRGFSFIHSFPKDISLVMS